MLYISIAIETGLNRESQLKKEWEPAMQRRREIWAPYPPPPPQQRLDRIALEACFDDWHYADNYMEPWNPAYISRRL